MNKQHMKMELFPEINRSWPRIPCLMIKKYHEKKMEIEIFYEKNRCES